MAEQNKSNQQGRPPENKDLVSNKDAIHKLRTELEAYEKHVLPDLLSVHNISPKQFMQIIISEVKRSDKLLQAFISNPFSMYASVLHGAEIGIIPSSLTQEASLIPRRIKGNLTVTYLLGYRGSIKVLTRTGLVSKIHTDIVFKGEKFQDIRGMEPKIIHEPNQDVERTAANIYATYAVATLPNGERQYVVLYRKDIDRIRALSPYENSLYFNDEKDPMHWMVRKCAIFQLDKQLPKDFYGAKAMETDRKVMGGANFELDGDEVRLVEDAPVKPTRFRKLSGDAFKLSAEDAEIINDINPQSDNDDKNEKDAGSKKTS